MSGFTLPLLLSLSTFSAFQQSATPVSDTEPPKANLADWTPRPAAGKVEAWEKFIDKDWIDARFRHTDTGPFQNATFRIPRDKSAVMAFKGTAVRVGDNGILFDRNSLRMTAGWVSGWISHSDRRFSLLNTPTPEGRNLFLLPAGPGWADPQGNWVPGPSGTTKPLPREWAHYRGLYRHGNRVVFHYTVNGTEVHETANSDFASTVPSITRQLSVAAAQRDLRLALSDNAQLLAGPGTIIETPVRHIHIPASSERREMTLGYGVSPPRPEQSIAQLITPGTTIWGEPIVTKLVRGTEDGPFAVDTLTLPYENRFKALFFCTGIDFLPDGRVAVSTCHGDVWLARINEEAATVAWQRFATGLYHPLGLKVVDGKIFVLERGQLTRLHDTNADGEADYYENFNNTWHCGGGEHSYDTCLETDPEGNFYFFKTGDTHLPDGGTLLRISHDGAKCEVMATGFRHPIGLGISPTGIITGADQEGNWMPATRVDQYRRGGFYGDMRAHHRSEPPKTYDGPLVWLPREVDNSAGGQVWIPPNTWGTLGGLPIHLSYGRCRAFMLLRHEYSGGVQGGVWDLGLKFLSGVCRGRFNSDGDLFVCGLNGWQTGAQKDGCVQRVRRTRKPIHVPTKLVVLPDGIQLTFSEPLERKSVENTANYAAARWNYRWSGEYGSPRLKVSDGKVGQDPVAIKKAELLPDGRTIYLRLADMRPVMQLQVGLNVKSANGQPVVGSTYMTVHHTGK